MKCCSSICLGIALVAFGAPAQDVVIVKSRSEQFVVYGAKNQFPGQPAIQSATVGKSQFYWYSPNYQTNESATLHLVPGLVAVSCERIKEAVLQELGERDNNAKKIHIQINPRLSEKDIRIMAAQYTKGWVYSVEFPQQIAASRLTTSITEILLTELANRQSTGEQFEVPLWFLLGFTAHLQDTRFESFALEPNLHLTRNEVKVDPVADHPQAGLRRRFSAELPLSFDELSWPDKLAPNKAALFQDSAHLFVFELLRMKEGRESARRFLAELPKYKNWQFAFLAAFKSNFTQLVDVEKWWALQLSSMAGRDSSKLWSAAESWEKLNDALDVPAQIHLKTDRLPVEARITLQEMLQQWDLPRQELSLRKTISRLRSLRSHVQPQLVALVDDYRKTLEAYVELRMPRERRMKFNQAEVSPGGALRAVCRQLDALDERRVKLRQAKDEQEISAKASVPELREAEKSNVAQEVLAK